MKSGDEIAYMLRIYQGMHVHHNRSLNDMMIQVISVSPEAEIVVV